MIASGVCPECGAQVGSDHGIDPYKHAVNCLHLQPGRPEDMIDAASKESEERGNRVRELLAMAEGKTEE